MAAKKDEEEKEVEVLKHELVPEHTLLGEEDAAELLKKYNITAHQLPKILTTDAVVKSIGAKEGQIIRIIRKSPTAGTATYYRLVIKS